MNIIIYIWRCHVIHQNSVGPHGVRVGSVITKLIRPRGPNTINNTLNYHMLGNAD